MIHHYVFHKFLITYNCRQWMDILHSWNQNRNLTVKNKSMKYQKKTISIFDANSLATEDFSFSSMIRSLTYQIIWSWANSSSLERSLQCNSWFIYKGWRLAKYFYWKFAQERDRCLCSPAIAVMDHQFVNGFLSYVCIRQSVAGCYWSICRAQSTI